MVVAVGVGVVLAALLFMRRMAEMTDIRLDTGTAHPFELPPGVQVYEVAGPLFFGAAERCMRALSPYSHTRAVILKMDRVPVVDATGLVALESALRILERVRCKVIFAGLTDNLRVALERHGIVRSPGRVAFAPDLEAAVSIAMIHQLRADDRSD
jgi:SulP family sulfate permease